MKSICPYFKDNHCGSKYLPELNLDLSIIPLWETAKFVKCPVYEETVKREEQEKKTRE